ncbi:hypothetical protein D3C78_1746920 [compost metagenome]
MGLQVDVPGIGRCRHIGHGTRFLRIAHVDDRKPLRPGMGDIGEAAMHHQLQTVAAPADRRVADQFHVVSKIRRGKVDAAHGLSCLGL